jgi:UDP-N-acetylmuramyl pentapeptide phosphotransferase/UDP-N-acetylglucosamine-1-phosphate transferase
MAALAAIAVALVTGPLRAWLIRRGVYDQPNARSSHAELKPRGGGIGVLAAVVALWLAGSGAAGRLDAVLPPAGLALGLGALSFLDDVRGLPPAARLAAQALAVGLGMLTLPGELVFPGLLPVWADTVLAALAWLWFINLYNFMDGIDGITGVETLTVGLGLGAVGIVLGAAPGDPLLPWLLAGAAAGFLWWNWAPARIFLGDVGSVTLGFLLGWLLLSAAANGAWAAALILPAYYLVDATLTLLRRAVRLEKVWRAHREHAYQRAVQAGRGHAWVAARVAAVNALLVALALWATAGRELPALTIAGAVSLGLWAGLLRVGAAGRRKARHG